MPRGSFLSRLSPSSQQAALRRAAGLPSRLAAAELRPELNHHTDAHRRDRAQHVEIGDPCIHAERKHHALSLNTKLFPSILCLSRACLGKLIVANEPIKMAQKKAFFPHRSCGRPQRRCRHRCTPCRAMPAAASRALQQRCLRRSQPPDHRSKHSTLAQSAVQAGACARARSVPPSLARSLALGCSAT